jgi:hypothetical protein|tara:strand:- start:202 stop:432 length:231 start_codon:yes stop_codon:yes gene_type:complete
MNTNPTISILSSFEKLKLPEPKTKLGGMGMMTRSRPPIQEKMEKEKEPMMIAREIQLHIQQARNIQKNGEDDGTIV